MAGDGIKTNRRARSQRNKIVTTLGGVAASAASLDAVSVVAPAIVPPGTGAAVAALCGMLATMVNVWWPK
jgi:hypothetical protein